MKILIFSTAYLSSIGGAEIAIDEISKRLPGVQFDMITTKMNRELPYFNRVGNVNVYRVGFGFSFDKFLLPFFGCFKAIRLNRKNQYDMIWSMMASQASIGAVFFKRLAGKKLVLTLQEGDNEDYLSRYVFGNRFLYQILIRPWHLLAFKAADFITAISEDLKNRAINNGSNCPIEIIPNGVNLDITKITEQKTKINELRKKLNIKDSEKVVITTSRLVKKNGIGDLIESITFLPRDVKLLILGIGELENELKGKIESLGIKDRVMMLGLITPEEVALYLGLSDVFVRPSLSEGLGNSFLEAMAVGVPIVGTRVGGIPDFLFDPTDNKEGATGLFCEVNNPRSIAMKTMMLINNQELREEIISNSRKLIIDKYSWEAIANKIKNVFEKLIQ